MAMPIYDSFSSPQAKYRPLPFWFWNSKMEPDIVEAQVRDFAQKGLGGFFIHARFGLETEYLSREWMECVERAVKTARETGLEVWLYDENGFPSGIGNLKVSRITDYRPKFVEYKEYETEGGSETDILLGNAEVLLARAQATGKKKQEDIDLTGEAFEGRLIWKAPRGSWKIQMYVLRYIEDENDVVYGVDYLNADAMQYFLDYSLAPYEKAVGEHFGKTIRGVFTDEPTLLAWHHQGNWFARREDARIVPWSKSVARLLEEKTGNGASELLPHIFFDVDESSGEKRRMFWQTVSEVYLESFFWPYKRWCEERDLRFTGHVLFEEGLYLNTQFQADITKNLAAFHIPGTDHLASVTETPYGGHCNLAQQLTNVQGEKLAVSTGRLAGKEAVISETYGCAGWQLDFATMKKIADWQYALGINMLCPHAFFYSIEGFRKLDAPPSQNHMCAWRHYRKFADYIGRLSVVMREGKPRTRTLVYYPLDDFQRAYTVGQPRERDRIINDSFDLACSYLLQMQHDYNIVTAEQLKGAIIGDGCIRIGGREYDTLVADESVVRNGVGDNIRGFVSTGGNWIIPPNTITPPTEKQAEGQMRRVCEKLEVNVDADMLEGVLSRLFGERAFAWWRKAIGDGAVCSMQTGLGNRDNFAGALHEIFEAKGNADITITGKDGEMLSHVRCTGVDFEDKTGWFVANTSDEAAKCRIEIATLKDMVEWDLETGEKRGVDSAIEEDKRTFTYTLHPCGSAFFVCEEGAGRSVSVSNDSVRDEFMTLADQWVFEPEAPNVLPIDQWDMRIETGGMGRRYVYSAAFDCETVPSEIMLALDDIEYRTSLMGEMDITIDLNGTSWHSPAFNWYIDRGIKTLDISSAVQVGSNTLTISILHSPWSGQPHLLNSPAAVIGKFALDTDRKKIIAPREASFGESWTKIGYPYYSGTARYTQGVRLPKLPKRARVYLAIDDVMDCVEVVVNDKVAGVRLWEPWEVDITDCVKSGRNTVTLAVTNSMINFLQHEPKASGLGGLVRVIIETQPKKKRG